MPPSPPILDYGMEPGIPGVSFQVDPNGAIHIEVRPQGLRRILRIDGTGSALAFAFALLFGIGAPMAGAVWAWRRQGEIIWMFLVPFALILAVTIPIAFALNKARRHVRISADSNQLTIWTNGPMDPRTYQWQREEIMGVEAKWTVTFTGDGDMRSGGLLIHSRHKTEVFLDFLPDSPVLEIAARVRRALGGESSASPAKRC